MKIIVKKVIQKKQVGEAGDSEYIVSVTNDLSALPKEGSQSIVIVAANKVEATQIALSTQVILDFIKE